MKKSKHLTLRVKAELVDKYFERRTVVRSKGQGRRKAQVELVPRWETAPRDYRNELRDTDPANYAYCMVNDQYQILRYVAAGGWWGEGLEDALAEFKAAVTKIKHEYGLRSRTLRPYYDLTAENVAESDIEPIVMH